MTDIRKRKTLEKEKHNQHACAFHSVSFCRNYLNDRGNFDSDFGRILVEFDRTRGNIDRYGLWWLTRHSLVFWP